MNLFTPNLASALVIYKMCKHFDRPVLLTDISTQLNSHPNPDSLLAISDVLGWFGIRNQAYQITANDLDEVTLPFIAHTRKKDNAYLLITHVDKHYLTIDNGYGLAAKIKRTKFERFFSGAILVQDEDEPVEAIGSTAHRYDFLISSLRNPVGILLMTLIVFASIGFNTHYQSIFSWQVLLLTLFKTIGLIIAILLLVQSIDSSNPLIQRLCGDKENDCNNILSSNAAKVFTGLSWSEVGFFYFGGTWLVLMFAITSTAGLQILALLNVLSLPYTFYSIYYQARVAKQWCILCCAIQALLWLEFVPLITYLHWPFGMPGFTASINMGVCMLLPVSLWIIFKPVLLQLQKIKPLQTQLQQFKYNNEFFHKLLNDSAKYALPSEDWSITLGNVEAEHTITMVSNPFCQPCAKAHQQLDDWLNHGDDIQVRLLFIAANNDDDPKTKVVRHLMALNALPDKTIVRQALHDWYNQKQTNYDAWAKVYPVNFDETQYDKLDKQRAWCNIAEVKATPFLLVNGRLLPAAYQVKDIKYML